MLRTCTTQYVWLAVEGVACLMGPALSGVRSSPGSEYSFATTCQFTDATRVFLLAWSALGFRGRL